MPAPGPQRTVPLPHAHELILENGLRVIAISRAEVPTTVRVPLVSAVIAFNRGSAGDPQGLSGLAAMTSALLSQGTKRLSALELGVAVDAIGARLDKASGYDASTSVASATTAAFPQALELLAETVREPAFAEEEFARVRSRALSDLRLSYSSPASLARLVVNRVVAGESPYAHPIAGTVASLEANMTREDRRCIPRPRLPSRTRHLADRGEIGVDEAFALVRRVFGDWKPDPHPGPRTDRGPGPAASAARRRHR